MRSCGHSEASDANSTPQSRHICKSSLADRSAALVPVFATTHRAGDSIDALKELAAVSTPGLDRAMRLAFVTAANACGTVELGSSQSTCVASRAPP
jgi:hypothetical protein